MPELVPLERGWRAAIVASSAKTRYEWDKRSVRRTFGRGYMSIFIGFPRAARGAALLATALPLLALPAQRAAAEDIKIGYIKVTALAPVMVAQGKGYFAAEGLNAELVPFDAPVPVAQAVVSGAVDFGTTGPSGAFYNLAGSGTLRIIAGMAREAPSFQFLAILASNRAYNAGLTSVKDRSEE